MRYTFLAWALPILGVSIAAGAGCGRSGPGVGTSATSSSGWGEPFTSEGGAYRIRLPFAPQSSKQEVQTEVGTLEMFMDQAIDTRGGAAYTIMYADYPVEAADPDALLDAVAAGVTQSGRMRSESIEPIVKDGHPGRRIVLGGTIPVAVEGRGEARIYLVGRRLYQVIVFGPKSTADDDKTRTFQESFELIDAPTAQPGGSIAGSSAVDGPAATAAPTEAPPAEIAVPAVEEPPPLRWMLDPLPAGLVEWPPASEMRGHDTPFRSVAPEGGVLAGLRVGYNRGSDPPTIGSIQPIYRVGDQRVAGPVIGGGGTPGDAEAFAEAGEGIGGLNQRMGLWVNGFEVVFRPLGGDRLAIEGGRTSEWMGDRTGGGPTVVETGGRAAVGVHGFASHDVISSLGLITREAEPAGP